MLPEPGDFIVRSVLRKHGFPDSAAVERAPFPGSINHTRLIGDVVVKFGIDPENWCDVYTEVVAAPAAFQAGVRTPSLCAFDDDRDLYDGPITVWDRARGQALGDLFEVQDLRQIYIEAARQAKVWHDRVETVYDPKNWLDIPEPIDPSASFTRCAPRIDADTTRWCEEAIARLAKAPDGKPAFGHWDLHAHNILVDDGEFSAVIDWGDAGFGDPILNFTSFPAEFLPECVETFGVPDDGFIGRLLREVLGYAINAYAVEDWKTLRHTGMKRWRSLQALYERDLDKDWRRWLGGPPPCTCPEPAITISVDDDELW